MPMFFHDHRRHKHDGDLVGEIRRCAEAQFDATEEQRAEYLGLMVRRYLMYAPVPLTVDGNADDGYRLRGDDARLCSHSNTVDIAIFSNYAMCDINEEQPANNELPFPVTVDELIVAQINAL